MIIIALVLSLMRISMIDYFFNIESCLLYLILFPAYLLLLFIIFKIGKRKIEKNKIAFYGMFMGLSNRYILALAFLLFYYYIIVVSIFINSLSYINLILLFVPIICFHIISLSFGRLLIDIIQTGLIFLLLYSKTILYEYIINVGNFWYVMVLFVSLCMYLFLYATFILIKRLGFIVSHSKYIKAAN